MTDSKRILVTDLFAKYLSQAGVDPKKLHPQQLTEARRAFWAGCGMMLKVLVGEVQNQPDEAAAASIVSDLMKQVDVFFAAELALQEQQLQDAKKSKILLPPGLKILK